MSKKKKKILFAAVDIGWRIEHYTNYINEYFSDKLEVDSFVKFYVPKKHYKTNYTYMYNFHKMNNIYGWVISFYMFIISLFKYDILHFFSGEMLLTRKLRGFKFKIYKMLGKSVIMHFVGTDIRSVDYILWKEKNIFEFLNKNVKYTKSLNWQKVLINQSLKYADKILVSSPDLKDVIPEAIYYPVVIDYKKIEKELFELNSSKKHKNEIVILHAPSNPKMKGTEIIHKVLKKIEANYKEFNIRLELPADTDTPYAERYSTSRYDLFKFYNNADIVIDQLIIGWYGLQAVEALIANNQVISYVDENLKAELYPNCPINIANANNLESIILQCIHKHIKGDVDFEKNKEWVKKYHTIENNNINLTQMWNLKNKNNV